MANTYFQFKQFTVHQERCAMKVGTDGTLLGAWANGGERILDVGTGTGLIALMMAQRFPKAHVTAIDIDHDAATQAALNAEASPFDSRIDVREDDVRCFAPPATAFDAIVCNPPYFADSLTSPDSQRTLARHTVSLTIGALMAAARRLLTTQGELSIIVPADTRSHAEGQAAMEGLALTRLCNVSTTPRRPHRRCLMAFSPTPTHHPQRIDATIQLDNGQRSPWYDELTSDFYL